jgi:hypothetical protein
MALIEKDKSLWLKLLCTTQARNSHVIYFNYPQTALFIFVVFFIIVLGTLSTKGGWRLELNRSEVEESLLRLGCKLQVVQRK